MTATTGGTMRAETPSVCAFTHTIPIRITQVSQRRVAELHLPNYSVAELIRTQLVSRSTLWIPRRVG